MMNEFSNTTNTTGKDKIKFLLLEGIHPSAIRLIQEAGYTQIECLATALSSEELKVRLKDVYFLGVRSRSHISKDVLQHANKLIAIGCFCIGTNQIDLQAASDLGIAVFNAPFSNTRSVAELVLAEAILLMRGIPEKNALAHEGKWLKSAKNSFEIRNKILGIVGYGAIGTQLSVLAESMGMTVIFFDIVKKLPLGNATQIASLDDLLAQADIVSLHVPETAATKLMMGSAQLSIMKNSSILINASRGTVLDIDALVDALESEKFLGAAIDVFPKEPASNENIFESPLRGFNNVILTPHIGGSTVEAQEKIGIEVSEKLIQYCENGTSISSVNLPEIALPSFPGKHRLLHIHLNTPGILAEINKVFSDFQINITAQYLQTRAKAGYVAIDIDMDSENSELALAHMAKIPGTLQSRILF